MKKILIILLLLPLVLAQNFPSYTDRYVNDFTNIFNASEKTELRSLLADVEQNSTAEVTVVTVNTTAPMAISEYATGLAETWRVGKSDVDNGLLILYAVTENKIFVAVGYGLEGILPDSKVGRMLDDYYVPMRDSNQTKRGIIDFTQAAAAILKANSYEIRSGLAGQNAETEFFLFFVVIGFIFLTIVAVFLFFAIKYKKFDKNGGILFGGGFGGGRGGFGGGGGGFGGGGFGGGGFGGGGAGR